MDRLLNVATLSEAVAVTVPSTLSLHDALPISIVIEAVLPVTVLPKLSCTVAMTAGLMATVETALVGCWLIGSALAAAAVTVHAVLVALVKQVLEAVSV